MADLAAALAQVVGSADQDRLASDTGKLIERYQADHPATPGQPIMAGDAEARAYAAYRMPATYAAIRSVLDQLPNGAPESHLDLAGGTGAAIWAVADRWPSIQQQTVIEQASAAIRLGQSLTALADRPSVRESQWRPMVFTGAAELPPAAVITIGYLLSEIEESLQQQVIAAAAQAAQKFLIIVEPGTKKGYRRIIAARDQLLAAGLQILAPCPHQSVCPLLGQDWCHFSGRVNRSAVHRRAKGAELGYEDEKFSYLVVSPEPAADEQDARVLRHPRFAKGRVELELCRPDGSASREIVAKRAGDRYRQARKINWGDRWPDPA